MPGIPSYMKSKSEKKKLLDLEVLSIISHHVFTLRMGVPVRVIDQLYIQKKQDRIPYSCYGYPDLFSYLASIEGLLVTMNSSIGQYQVEAAENYFRSSIDGECLTVVEMENEAI